MSATLPNGATFALGTTYAATKTISAVTNANPAVATATSHGYTDGDFVLLSTSGWSRTDNRVVRVDGSLTNSFEYEGIDSSSTTLFPAGSGAGTASKITAWTSISQVLEATGSGGDQQFATYSYMDQDFDTQIPTTRSAQQIQLTMADDSSLGWHSALKTASETKAARALKVVLPSGAILLYYGYVSFNETPVMTKNQVMAVRATFSLLNAPVRYSS